MANKLPSLEEIEILIRTMKELLYLYEATSKEDEIRNKIVTLETWMKVYRSGLSAANMISNRGTEWLAELSTNLKMSAEELERFSNEGGNNTITRQQAIMVEKFSKASTNIKQMTLALENLLSKSHTTH